MLACVRCRAEIPGDSTFCPLCGTKTTEVDGADTLTEEMPATMAEAASAAAAVRGRAARFTVPRPPDETPLPAAGSDLEMPAQPADPMFLQVPVAPVARPAAPDLTPRRTLVMSPGGAPAEPLAPQLRHATPVVSPISGHPGPVPRIPVTPSPARIAIGVMLLALALWLAVWFMPRLGEDVTSAGRAGAGAVAVIGLVFVLFGVLHRAHAEVMCRRCRRPVVAWKAAFGLQCPLGPHHARINYLMIALTAAFWSMALAVALVGAAWFL